MNMQRWRPDLLTVAFSAFIASVVFLAAVLVYSWVNPTYAPLEGYGRAHVVNVGLQVEGAPAFQPGDVVVLQIERCNRSNEPVWIVSQHNFERRENDRVLTVPAASNFGHLTPECSTKVWVEEMPAAMMPGQWRVVGMDETSDGRRVQLQAWESEPFWVLPP